jgi:putative nucleotidyltransferase with HDIG domain
LSQVNPKKILLVDDDDALRQVLGSILIKAGFLVTPAQDGPSAQSLIALEQFDLVISDIRMPGLSGIELMHFIKRTRPMPILLMTGFSEILEAKDAQDMGAAGFLAKPFRQGDLITLVREIIGQTESSAPPVEDIDDLFSSLRVDDFLTGKEIMFDIFVRLSATKYIKVATGGESIGLERINVFKAKGLTHLYLRKDDFRKYLGFAVNLAAKVADAKSIDNPRKLKVLTQTSGTLIKSLYLDDLSKEKFEAASELVLNTVSLMGEDTDILQLMEAIKSQSDHLYRHSLAVSVYSVLIAKAAEWKSPRTIMLASMAGMIHDIGKKQLPKELLDKPKDKMDAAEVKLYETHTGRGLELLSRMKGVPEDVAIVAAQHHEECTGTGFPQHLPKNKVSPLARLVGLANAFCELAFAAPGFDGMSASQALTRITSLSPERYDAEFLKALSSLFSGKHAGAAERSTKQI